MMMMNIKHLAVAALLFVAGCGDDIGQNEARKFLVSHGYTVIEEYGTGFVCEYQKVGGDTTGPAFRLSFEGHEIDAIVCPATYASYTPNPKDPMGELPAWTARSWHKTYVLRIFKAASPMGQGPDQ